MGGRDAEMTFGIGTIITYELYEFATEATQHAMFSTRTATKASGRKTNISLKAVKYTRTPLTFLTARRQSHLQ